MATNTKSLDRSMIGSRVYTNGGEQLGTVKDVRGACFEVQRPMEPAYWLSGAAIDGVQPDRVNLVATTDELGDYEVANPDVTGGGR